MRLELYRYSSEKDSTLGILMLVDDETDKKLNVERERIAATDKIAQDRIDSQEDIAQLRANVNLSKQKQ